MKASAIFFCGNTWANLKLCSLGWFENYSCPPGGVGGCGCGEEHLDLPAQPVILRLGPG